MKAFKDTSKSTSISSSGGSPDSVTSSNGGKFSFENGRDVPWQQSTLSNLSSSTGSDSHASPIHEPIVRRDSRSSNVSTGELSEINK